MLRIKNTLGINIGGTSIKVGFLRGPGPVVQHFRHYPTPKTTAALWRKLIDIIIDYTKRYRVQTLGVGCRRPLDMPRGKILKTSHLPFSNFPLKQLLLKKTGLPVVVDNDANALTLAEAIWGAGRPYQHIVGLTLGTGLGGGIVINQKIYHSRGNAGELGYLLINSGGSRGRLGELGAAQEYLCAGSLLKNSLGLNHKKITDVKSLTADKSKHTQLLWYDYGYNLGYLLASLTHILDPDVIILGGQISKAWPRFIDPPGRVFSTNCVFNKLPHIKRVVLGD